MLRVTVAMRTDADASAQVFYGQTFEPTRSMIFPVSNDNKDHEYTFIIPDSTGKGTRLRLDPCHGAGTVLVQQIRVEALQRPPAPVFDKPGATIRFEPRHSVKSGQLQIEHHPAVWNGIRLRLGDQDLAGGYDGEMIGRLTADGAVEYLKLKEGNLTIDGGLRARATIQDKEGGTWTVVRTYRPANPGNAVEVDRDRRVVLLPWFTLLPGHGSYGSRKHQGLFAGLEYLSDEPSSSEADLTGPAHLRRVPQPTKITFPLMAIEYEGSYVGLIWDKSETVAAGFDSPDRVFGSDGHALWLSGPSVGKNRFENDLVGHSPTLLQAGVPLTVRTTIIAGRSSSVLGAVKHYVSLRPLPDLPAFEGGYNQAVDLLAHGWLDSAANVGWQFQRAVWLDIFKPKPAAGAAMFLSWLGEQALDPGMRARLKDGTDKALAQARAQDPLDPDASEIGPPNAPLIFGKVPEFIARKRNAALEQLQQFDDQGRVIYRVKKKNYGKTHFANHANGLGGRVLAEVLEAATWCTDTELTEMALGVLDQQTTLYASSVPRGAQTWEVPLHTPDIVASAHMIRAYVYGYVLTGQADYLEQAKYWAWSGVPFVYLVNPTEGTCGPYATVAVLGATNWIAPVWLGLPVQWCGLVYGSALHLLSEHDSTGPWKQLARGITLAGLQMTFPTTDAKRQGLLPDFFHFELQGSDGPAIHPGVVGAHLPEAFDKGTIYDFRRLAGGGFLHAPCAISKLAQTDKTIQFELAGWGERPYRIVLIGVNSPPLGITANTKQVQAQYHADQRLLVVPLKGTLAIEIRMSD
jgi:hypothetical protein